MKFYPAICREMNFMAKDRAVTFWLLVIFCLSALSIWSGLTEVRQQEHTLRHLIEADKEDRSVVLSQQGDAGWAAYYSFHLTYDQPSDFAFAALGQRDVMPWKHRVRMLALEGQVYERDVGNPVLALIGRFDFAFLAVFILPLVIIMLLHDLRAGERAAGRHDLLVATVGKASSLFFLRASLRVGALCVSTLVPLLLGGWLADTAASTLFWSSVSVFVYVVFWALISYWLAAWRQPAAVILAGLIGVWILLSVIIPAGGRLAINQLVPIPAGADIIMTQREAVNDAWDLPKEVTMAAFLRHYPQWSDYAVVQRPFEWKWYYAFQQVGDQKTEPLSSAYREGRLTRDKMAAGLAFIVPPVMLERVLQKLAGTDVRAMLNYEDRVRAFHAELRHFYYPKLFRGESTEPFIPEDLPVFDGAVGKVSK